MQRRQTILEADDEDMAETAAHRIGEKPTARSDPYDLQGGGTPK
jgi:hypothetical protein